MKPVYYVDNKKPQSYNDRSKSLYKKHHSERFYNSYSSLYSGLPTKESNLQSQLTYIYHRKVKMSIPDVDNLSKPIIDAFSGVIYEDDRQIIKRVAQSIELSDLQFVTIDLTQMPTKVAEDLDVFIEGEEEHILLLSINKIELDNITIGGI